MIFQRRRFLDTPTHLYKRSFPFVHPSVHWFVRLSIMLLLKQRKIAKFTKNLGSVCRRAWNRGSESVNHSLIQSITHSLNHLFTGQGASLAYVGVVKSRATHLYKSLHQLVFWSVCCSVRSQLFCHFVSVFCQSAPAQSYLTDAVMYTAPPPTPDLDIHVSDLVRCTKHLYKKMCLSVCLSVGPFVTLELRVKNK